MEPYLEHPSKATFWNGDLLDVLPEAEAADSTVWCGLPEEGSWEGLLAIRAGDIATIAAVPAFAHDLHLGDQVELIESAEGVPVIRFVRVRGGNLTFRAWLADVAVEDPWLPLLHRLRPYNCVFDVWSPNLVAISAALERAQAVADALTEEEQTGLVFETGAT